MSVGLAGDDEDGDFLCAVCTEEFGGGVDGSARGVDVVEEDVVGFGAEVGLAGESLLGLGEALGASGAELDGIFCSGENGEGLAVFEFSQVAGEEGGVVETALADVVARGGGGNDDCA